MGKVELIARQDETIGGVDYQAGDVFWTIHFVGHEDELRPVTWRESWLLYSVANGLEEVQGAGKAADAEEYSISGIERNHIIYKCDKDSPGYVKFNSGGASLFQITAKMNREEKLHLYLAEDDGDVLTALDDLGLDPEAIAHTYTLEGVVPFQNPARHTLQADYADQYRIYAFDGKKSLTEVKAEWNSMEGVYEWQATAMTTYVISDRELKLPDPKDSPKTGA